MIVHQYIWGISVNRLVLDQCIDLCSSSLDIDAISGVFLRCLLKLPLCSHLLAATSFKDLSSSSPLTGFCDCELMVSILGVFFYGREILEH